MPRSVQNEGKQSPCLSEDRVIDHAFGRSNGASGQVQAHILACERCRFLVVEAARAAVPADRSGRFSTFSDGEQIAGRYTIRQLLARGGMGEVYEVEDELLGDVVALKTIAVDAIEDPLAIERVKREVLLARRVSHAHVCRIIEFGTHSEASGRLLPFLTMERLHGETLGQRLSRKGALPLAQVKSLAVEILEGLAAIHRSGIVHRDFKTDNVFLARQPTAPERCVVLDFGLARALQPSAGRPSLTAGRLAGTVEYMSPEQLEGAAPGVHFDIYAFGVVLFELLTGRRPFVGGTMIAEAARRLAQRPPKPSSQRPDLPRGWDAIALRCLEREPRRRYGSVEEIQSALAALDRGRRVRRPLPAALLVGAGSIAGLVAMLEPKVARPPATAVASVEAPPPSVPRTAVPPLKAAVESPAPAAPVPPRTQAKRGRQKRSVVGPAPSLVVAPLGPSADELWQRADRLLALGDLEEACAAGERIKRETPEAPAVYRFLGKCYMRNGQPDVAKRHYREYLGRAPDAPDAVIIRKIVE